MLWYTSYPIGVHPSCSVSRFCSSNTSCLHTIETIEKKRALLLLLPDVHHLVHPKCRQRNTMLRRDARASFWGNQLVEMRFLRLHPPCHSILLLTQMKQILTHTALVDLLQNCGSCSSSWGSVEVVDVAGEGEETGSSWMDIFIASEQVVNRLKFDLRCCGEGGYKYKIFMLLIIP